MKKNLLYLSFLLCNLSLVGQTTGDIFIIGFNADGDDDLAFVTFANINPETVIYFTDRESDGSGGLTSGEGTLIWNSGPRTIKAGSVVVFTDVDNGSNANFGSSSGTLNETGSFSLPSSSKDGIIVFKGSDENSPTTFISAIQIGNDNSVLGPFDLDGITLSNTGLQIGTSIIVFDDSATPDGAAYNASRSNQFNFNDYFLQISDDTNNWINVVNGDGNSLLPFSQEAFTKNSTNWTGTSNSVWNLAENWDNGIPSSNSLAIIPDVETSPVISSGIIAEAGNLIINSGETLTINDSNALTVSGDLTINGDLTLHSGGSLIASGASNNNLTYNRNLGTANWYLVSSPFVGQTIVNFYTNESPALGSGSGDAQNVGIAPYDNSQTTGATRWVYYTEGQVDGVGGDDTTDTFGIGVGYSVIMQAAGDVAFTGTMTTDNVGIAITDGTGSGGNAFNLIGNPYPSFIAANINANTTNNLLTVNTSSLTEETLWFWDQSTSTYDPINQTDTAFNVAPAQGFFVSSTGSNTFNFTEIMQSHQSTDSFQRTTNNRPEITISMTNGTTTRDARILYIDGTSTGFDNGYDSSIFGGVSNSFAIYTHAVANGNGKDLGIQSLPDNDFENMIIPVGINANPDTEITISAASINLPAGINVYLEDKDDDSFTLLNNSSDFITTLSSNLNGIGRFYIHTTPKVLSVDEANLDNISIYTSNTNNLRIVGVQNGTAQVSIYNILGKQVMNTSFEGDGLNDITLPNLRTGVYIIQLETETGKLNKKVIIE